MMEESGLGGLPCNDDMRVYLKNRFFFQSCLFRCLKKRIELNKIRQTPDLICDRNRNRSPHSLQRQNHPLYFLNTPSLTLLILFAETPRSPCCLLLILASLSSLHSR